MDPIVTVLMPVYNGETFLQKAIESILNQTFTNFEFLIINDGSTDNSVNIIQSYNDPRIRLVHNTENLQLIATLNKGINLARGKYIVRMDCDDISLPERLIKQVNFMDAHLDVGVCGSSYIIIDENDKLGKVMRFPTDCAEIKVNLLFRSVIPHPSVIIRKSLIDKYNLFYDINKKYAEDYDLWQRASECFSLANMSDILLRYRIHSKNISRMHEYEKIETLRNIHRTNISRLGIIPNKKNLDIHLAIALRRSLLTKNYVKLVEYHLRVIQYCNKKRMLYPEPKLSMKLREELYISCSTQPPFQFSNVQIYINSLLTKTFLKNKKVLIVNYLTLVTVILIRKLIKKHVLRNMRNISKKLLKII